MHSFRTAIELQDSPEISQSRDFRTAQELQQELQDSPEFPGQSNKPNHPNNHPIQVPTNPTMQTQTNPSDQILGNLSTAILLLDADQRVLYTNMAAESLLQLSAPHMRGRWFSDLFAEGTGLAAILDDALATNRSYTGRKLTLPLPGREDITVDFTVTAMPDTREPGKLLIELMPMDRYRRIERDAALKEQYAVTLQMARGLAHEIKNPLGGIKGSAQLLAKELTRLFDHQDIDNPFEEYTDIIIEETDRLTALVNRMLGPTDIPERQSTNIHLLLERIGRLVELEARESLDSLRFIRDYDPSLPEALVDPQLIMQALLNITRNAMQSLEHTTDPTIRLVTRIERQFTIGGRQHKVLLRIDICDNGPGIPEPIQEHLFYPMISGRAGGTGLGLSFAQAIISQHQGIIEFESSAGGATFTIFIPLEQPA